MPNKLLYLDSNGKLPADITGDAQSLAGHDSTYFAIATHRHDNATATADGYMAKEDKTELSTLSDRVNQGVKTTDTPTFAGITLNGGYIDGAKFR